MSTLTSLQDSPRAARLRSGTAARLAGLPVATLRVWERRYGVVAADKTNSGQRLYTHHDIARLKLLRQLTLAGHTIGTISGHDLGVLQALADDLSAASTGAARGVCHAVVVGRRAAHALESVPGCQIDTVYEDLDEAERGRTPETAVGLLLVRLASLQPGTVERVLALAKTLLAGATLVIYGFGADSSVRALQAAGVALRREPVSGRELARWVRDLGEAPTAGRVADREPALPVAPRRFNDDTLARLAEMPSPVACECLRHMSEIVVQLGAFERYSEDCMSSGAADAALHRHLCRTAGVARTLFEEALLRLVIDEELLLPDGTVG